MACILFIPGRVQGFFWRKFFRGRKLASAGKYPEALLQFELFLQELQHRPWLKHLMWLGYGVYTRKVEAMTWLNIGTIFLREGEFELAEKNFHTAIELDADYPLPHFNLAIIHQVRGCEAEAEEAVAKARELGFEASRSDKLVAIAGELLAQIEGR
jgi:tetratricopeptide (TPR) repeat protein